MKKTVHFFSLLLVLGISSFSGFSQKTGRSAREIALSLDAPAPSAINAVSPGGRSANGYANDRCGFVTNMNRLTQAGFDRNAFEAIIAQRIASQRPDASVNYVIPVVFHIIHDGTAEGTGANLLASQVNEQIKQLNIDFGNYANSSFPVAAHTGVSFCPVLQNPSGVNLAQPGINRIDRVAMGWTDPTTFTDINSVVNYVDATIKPASIWDPSRFMNIWVYNFSASGLLGYATFPTAGLPDLPPGETPTTAGVVFLTGALGSVTSPGTAGAYGLGRTVSHEIGHFLGLYHIWGDVADCTGTDYCADTPPCSDAFYSTVPGCSIPTQCSSPRMIQNYMDYSDDGCMNTFTQNQRDRIQAVMAVSPRRPKNPVSTMCTPLVGNALNFLGSTSVFSETGTSGAACPRYRDVVIGVTPVNGASGAATVNFLFTGTATLNADYAIIGSSSVSYTNGDNTTKSITVRIFDDKISEPDETIIINYSITGSGLIAGTYNTTHTITVQNDDFDYDVNNTTPVVTLLNETFGTTTGSNQVPAGWTVSNSGTATNKFVGNNAGAATYGFTGNTLHISNGNAAAVTNGTAAMAYTITTTTDARVTTPTLNATGMGNISLAFSYVCNGEEDADGIYDFGVIYYSVDGGTNYNILRDASNEIIFLVSVSTLTNFNATLPLAANGAPNLKFLFRWISDNSFGTNPPLAIDNVVVTGNFVSVESTANQPSTENIATGAGINTFYSTDGQVIAKVSNTSANIGCLTANVSAAGTTLQPLTTNAGAYQRSSKVITLVPSTANTTASYTATFYYTTAEVAAWGASVPTLKLLKVRDGVSLSSTLTGANAALVTPTVDDQRGTKGYVSYTGNFTGGFSQFLLVSPTTALPVTELNFEAAAKTKNIVLTWTTESENNNRGFVVERSTNGSIFERIGWKDGKINSSQRSYYSFEDNFVQPGVLYFYRLRQTDLDSRENISVVRQAKVKGGGGMEVIISPNPAKDAVKVFVAGAGSNASVSLLNAKGQLIKKWMNQNVTLNNRNELDIRGLASGIYMLRIETGGQVLVEKLTIQ